MIKYFNVIRINNKSPGSYCDPNTIFMLSNDISDPNSDPIIVEFDGELDLYNYLECTFRYCGGDYCGFITLSFFCDVMIVDISSL